MSEQQEVIKALQKDWEINLHETLSEEAIIEQLALQIAAVVQQGPETFFQLMYRLDVPERKLNEILISADNQYKIARLVYERQLQKIRSRTLNKSNNGPADPELEW